ncbi:hypothetical protein V6N11_036349 [Hibiscus sabdariffa]|uniref:Uncharacterized protein n=1 Tax=Hibiscus sabdariffa TaxID=183260 RepID=A0ABR2RA63_9ROSI
MMSPQISEGSHNSPRILGDGSVPLTGVVNGRPLDSITLISVPSKLEQVAQPISEEDQQVVKQSRGEGDEVMDVSEGDFIGLSQGTVLGDGVTPMVREKGYVNGEDGAGQVKPSFRDMTSSIDAGRNTTSARDKDESSEKYGPWMMVSGRKARRESRGMNVESNGTSFFRQGVKKIGKFDVLASLETEVDGDVERAISRDLGTYGSDVVACTLVAGVDNLVTEAAMDQVVDAGCHGDERIILQGLGSVGKVSHANERVSVGGSEVVSSDVVVPVRVSLDPKAHVAVQVVEPGKKMDVLNTPSRRVSADDGVLGEWIGELEHELDDNGKEKSVTVLTGDSSQRKSGANVQWRSNTVFSSKLNR